MDHGHTHDATGKGSLNGGLVAGSFRPLLSLEMGTCLSGGIRIAGHKVQGQMLTRGMQSSEVSFLEGAIREKNILFDLRVIASFMQKGRARPLPRHCGDAVSAPGGTCGCA